MSAMKPDAWMDSNGVCYTNKVSAEYYGCSEPLYTLATVRKWLEEDPSVEMYYATDDKTDAYGYNHKTKMPCSTYETTQSVYRAMIAAKLRELEGGDAV